MALYSRMIRIYGKESEDLKILNEILFYNHEEYEQQNPSITPELIQKGISEKRFDSFLEFELVHGDKFELTEYSVKFTEFSRFWGYPTIFLESITYE